MGEHLPNTLTIKTKTHSILDDYIIYWKDKLGTGISGPVRSCKKLSTGERFAVKCLPDTMKTRMEINLHVLCSGHPHIVSVYDVFANDVQFPGECHPRPRLLMVMELMEGGELFDRISKERCFTEKRATFYMKQIASAIKRCHSLNIAHRDLKPENLLLKDNSEDALVKLTDFGFAKFDNGKLMTPHFTPYYVAPQVLEAYRYCSRAKLGLIQTTKPCTYDKSCDMWSLGVILYIMLCGYPPFYSETPSRQLSVEMKRKILTGDYEFPEEDWEFISPTAKDVVRGLLHVEPIHRMSVDDLEQSPWLKKNAPETVLHSPSIIANKNAQEDMKMAHSEYLSTMRQPENFIKLKPLNEVNNPIIRKRQRRSCSGSQNMEAVDVKKSTENVNMKSIRDVIAHCILPQSAEEDEKMITNLTIRALSLNDNNSDLLEIFRKSTWECEKFNEKVDRKKLAQHLSEYLLAMESLPKQGMKLASSSSSSSSPSSPYSFASPPSSSYISPASYSSPSYPSSSLSPTMSSTSTVLSSNISSPPTLSPSNVARSPTLAAADTRSICESLPQDAMQSRSQVGVAHMSLEKSEINL